MRLDPVSLRLFVAVMEEQAIARAAAREHIATSAASRRLSELEAQLQVRLFERSNRGITPTAAAYTLLDLARSVLHARCANTAAACAAMCAWWPTSRPSRSFCQSSCKAF